MNIDIIGRVLTSDNKLHQRFFTNRTFWLQLGLVLGVALFSIALPFLPGRSYHIYLLGLVPLAFAVFILLRNPGLGLVLLIVAALLAPFSLGTGSETSIDVPILLLMLLIGLWLLKSIVQRDQINFRKSRTFLPLVIFLAVCLAALVVGQLPWFSFSRQSASFAAQFGGLLLFFFPVGTFFLVANQLKETRWLKWMTWIFIGLGALYIAGWILPFVGSITSQIYQFGVIDNGMFWTWLVALAFSQALINNKLSWGWRIAVGMVVVATLYVAYFDNSGWKSGYLPPLASIFVIVLIRSWRAGLVLGLAGLFLVPFLVNDAISTDQYSYSTRLEAALILVGEIIRVNPVLGFGPANYYWYTPLFEFRGWAARFNSHNQYLDIIAQIGFLGLLIFIWFVFELVRVAARLRNQVQSGFEQAYIYGVLGGLAGTLAAGALADWFLPFVYNVGFRGLRGSILAWIFMGGLVSLEVITNRRAEAAGSGGA